MQLEKKLREEPTYPIPEGYQKIKEEQQTFKHNLSPTLLSFLSEG